MPEQQLTVHESLADCLNEVNGRVPDGMRPYVVTTPRSDDGTHTAERFVITKSPGQAAQAVCEVRACTRQEAMDAVLALYDRQRKAAK